MFIFKAITSFIAINPLAIILRGSITDISFFKYAPLPLAFKVSSTITFPSGVLTTLNKSLF